MGFDMEMDDFHDEQEFNEKELERLKKEILDEAKKVKSDYKANKTELSGSVFHVHENSPYLDTKADSDEPLYSGSRWEKVLKSF
tara:strand:+ start:80 stop:331 length:252 start_codon:yes stop_codon:yes gene_type:complete